MKITQNAHRFLDQILLFIAAANAVIARFEQNGVVDQFPEIKALQMERDKLIPFLNRTGKVEECNEIKNNQ